MSTAATTRHRFSDPIAMAAAVAVIIGGAAVIGLAASQDSSPTPTAPAAPAHGKVTTNDPSRIGLGDFNDFIHHRQGAANPPTLKGGHVMEGQP